MKPLILAVLILGLLCPLLHAQEPFANDLNPTLTFSEKYTETLAGNATDGYYTVPASAITITGSKFSLTGMSPMGESAAISISLGDFIFTAYLSEDPNRTNSLASFPIFGTGPDGKNPQIGTVKVAWTASAMSFVVTIPAGSVNTDTFVAAYNFAGGEGALYTWPLACAIGFGIDAAERVMDTRSVYPAGTASQTINENAPNGYLAKVNLTGGFDILAPRAAVTFPAMAETVYYPYVNIGGTVNDSQSSPMTVSVKINNAPPIDVDAGGWAAWSIPVPVLVNEGNNTVTLRATDMDGNVSGWTPNSTFVYSKTTPLVVSVSGLGTTSISGTTYQRTGMNLPITATPATGYVFDHWEGDIGPVDADSSSTTLYVTQPKLISFVMQPYSTLTAVFVPGSYPGVAGGSYSGILVSGMLPNGDGGGFSLKMTSSGGFTGKFTLGGVDYPIKGQFNNSGLFAGTFGTKNQLFLTLEIKAVNGSNKITGVASVGEITAMIQSDLAFWDPVSNPLTSGTGNYTFLLPFENTEDPTVPQGTGYGTATIDPAGAVKLSGVLGDGTKFAASSVVTKDLTFSLFVPLYNKRGALSGEIAIDPIDRASDFNGDLAWYKPALKSSFYPGEFYLIPTIMGSRYEKTALPGFNGGKAYLSIPTSASDSTLISSTTSLISLSPNKYKAAPLPGSLPNPNKLAFTVTPATGLFSGSFVNGSFKGAVFQKQSLGGGVFMNKTQSGSVQITGTTPSGLGSGSLTLSGSNTYTGGTVITSGSLQITGSSLGSPNTGGGSLLR